MYITLVALLMHAVQYGCFKSVMVIWLFPVLIPL